MLFDFLRNGRKKSLGSTWLWVVMVVVIITRGNTQTIHSKAEHCKQESGTKVQCDLPAGNKDYELIAFNWEENTKVIIYANYNRVSIKKPYSYRNGTYCNKKTHEVTIENATRVTTEQNQADDFCPLQLILKNCEDVNIDSFVNLVRLTSTKAERVVLPQVTQFDLEDSTVEEVSLTIDGSKSVIINSIIKTVTQLNIVGDFDFTIKNSTLRYVKRFIYVSDKNSLLDKVTIDYLYAGGFQVRKSTLILQNSTIKDMEPSSMVVMQTGKLTLSQSKLGTTSSDSIVVKSGGGIVFTEMTFGIYANVSFDLRDSSIELYPLTVLMDQLGLSTIWIVIGVVFGLLVGSSTAVAAMLYIKKRLNYKIPSQDPSCQNLTTEMEECQTNTIPNKILNPLKRPLPKVPDAEPDVDYIDVQVPDSSQVPPNGRMDQRPPLSTPKKPPYTPGINTQGMPALPNQPKPNTTNNSYRNDIRDILPPPPPPEEEEELYDDLEGNNSNQKFAPKPPPPTRKPFYHPR